MTRTIAIYGGSFDPPHVGHLLVATHVLATQPVDELWFVPTHTHMLGKQLTEFTHRLAMTKLLVAAAAYAIGSPAAYAVVADGGAVADAYVADAVAADAFAADAYAAVHATAKPYDLSREARLVARRPAVDAAIATFVRAIQTAETT